jgi:hypothetical protein
MKQNEEREQDKKNKMREKGRGTCSRTKRENRTIRTR